MAEETPTQPGVFMAFGRGDPGRTLEPLPSLGGGPPPSARGLPSSQPRLLAKEDEILLEANPVLEITQLQKWLRKRTCTFLPYLKDPGFCWKALEGPPGLVTHSRLPQLR